MRASMWVGKILTLVLTILLTSLGARAELEMESTPAASTPSAQTEPPVAAVPSAPAPPAQPRADAKAESKPINKPEPAKPDDKLTAELKKICEKHYPGAIQAEIRQSCVSSAADFQKYGKALVQTRCRLNYGEEPQLVMACLVGAAISDDVLGGRDTYKQKLQQCAENYPVHNEIDAFLQESCLTGIHLPDLMKTDGKARFEICAQISPERSFIGPCAVGLTLAQDAAASAPTLAQNKLCDQYFNLHRFHKGYRACLNARSLAAPDLPTKYSDAMKSCANVVTEVNNDTEKAACLVGLTIYKHLISKDDVSKRFQKCGDNKVTYQDRDFLACLTAASLLEFTDKSGATTGCKEIFKDAKKGVRGDCVNSLNLF